MSTVQPVLDPTNSKHQHADERLRIEPIIWLSSVRLDGRPHLVPVWFLWDAASSSLLIFSKPDQKIDNLRANPNVMLALNSPTGNDVVLLEGTASLLERGGVNTTEPAYVAKYASLLEDMGWTGESMAAVYWQAIRVQVSKVRAW